MRGRIAAIAFAAACLLTPTPARAQEFVYDPFENTNRHLFAFNETLDHHVTEPVARGYRAITNQPVRSGVSNFLHNLSSPVIFANDVLQGQVKRAGVTVARFGVNSTIGVLGLFDPARSMGLESHDEDFGQTLAVWGVPSGPYLFVPLVGPTNLRDGVGHLVDLAFDPLNYAEFDGDSTFRGTRIIVGGIATREALLDEVDGVRQNSMDPYTTVRSSYGLLRYSAIKNGQAGAQALPEFEEIPSDETQPSPAQQPEPQTPAPTQQQDHQQHPAQAGTISSASLTTGELQ